MTSRRPPRGPHIGTEERIFAAVPITCPAPEPSTPHGRAPNPARFDRTAKRARRDRPTDRMLEGTIRMTLSLDRDALGRHLASCWNVRIARQRFRSGNRVRRGLGTFGVRVGIVPQGILNGNCSSLSSARSQVRVRGWSAQHEGRRLARKSCTHRHVRRSVSFSVKFLLPAGELDYRPCCLPRTMRISRTPPSNWVVPSATKPCLR